MESEWIMMFRQMVQPHDAGNYIASRIHSLDLPREECGDRQLVDTYRAVLRSLFGTQCLSSRRLPKPFLFIFYSEADSLADSKIRSGGHSTLPEYIRRAITRGSDNLPLRIMWIEENIGVGSDPEGEFIPSGGAIVRFNATRQLATDTILVKGRIHRWGMASCGFEFVVEKRGGFSMVRNATP
jgi:hypothetical protein